MINRLIIEKLAKDCLDGDIDKAVGGNKVYCFNVCPNFVYLSLYGPLERRKMHDFMLEKMEEGKEYEDEIMEDLDLEPVLFETIEEGVQKTLEMIQRGDKMIGHSVLYYLKERLAGTPDIIRKRSGKSVFGSYHYEVVEVKSALNVYKKYIMQVVHYSWLLSKIQGYLPPKAYLLMGDGREEEIIVDDYLEELKEQLKIIEEIVDGKRKCTPTVGGGCGICEWKDYCFEKAIEKGDISLVPGVGEKTKAIFVANGIKTVHDLLGCDLEKLSKIKGCPNPNRLERMQLHAKSLTTKQRFGIGEICLPKRTTEIFLDVETTDVQHEIWLIGLLIRRSEKETVKQFYAKTLEHIEGMFEQFKEFMKEQNDFAIYTYTSYDIRALEHLGQKYGIDPELRDKIFSNMFDLHKELKRTVILPTLSYSLKEVAPYLGFEWKEKIDAPISMLLYKRYQQTRDKDLLKLALEYNRDDLVATRTVKDFLSNKEV